MSNRNENTQEGTNIPFQNLLTAAENEIASLHEQLAEKDKVIDAKSATIKSMMAMLEHYMESKYIKLVLKNADIDIDIEKLPVEIRPLAHAWVEYVTTMQDLFEAYKVNEEMHNPKKENK